MRDPAGFPDVPQRPLAGFAAAHPPLRAPGATVEPAGH